MDGLRKSCRGDIEVLRCNPDFGGELIVCVLNNNSSRFHSDMRSRSGQCTGGLSETRLDPPDDVVVKVFE